MLINPRCAVKSPQTPPLPPPPPHHIKINVYLRDQSRYCQHSLGSTGKITEYFSIFLFLQAIIRPHMKITGLNFLSRLHTANTTGPYRYVAKNKQMSSVVIVILGNLQCVELFLHLDIQYRIWSKIFKVYLGFCIQLYSFWLRSRNSPPPPTFGLIIEGAIGQPR